MFDDHYYGSPFDYTPDRRLQVAWNEFNRLNKVANDVGITDADIVGLPEYQIINDLTERYTYGIILKTNTIEEFDEYMGAFIGYFKTINLRIKLARSSVSQYSRYKSTEFNPTT